MTEAYGLLEWCSSIVGPCAIDSGDRRPDARSSTLRLQAVSGGFADIGYVVENGVITIATVQSLPSKLETRVYDITDLAGNHLAAVDQQFRTRRTQTFDPDQGLAFAAGPDLRIGITFLEIPLLGDGRAIARDRATGTWQGREVQAFDLMVATNCEIFRTVGTYAKRWYLSDLYLKELTQKQFFDVISVKYELLAKRRNHGVDGVGMNQWLQ